MAVYDFLFNGSGLRGWCDAAKTGDAPLSMADLLAKGAGDLTKGVETGCRRSRIPCVWCWIRSPSR